MMSRRAYRVYRGIPGPVELVNDATKAVFGAGTGAVRVGMSAVEIIVAVAFIFCAIALIVSIVVIAVMALLIAFAIIFLVTLVREVARHVKAKRAMMVTTDPTLEER